MKTEKQTISDLEKKIKHIDNGIKLFGDRPQNVEILNKIKTRYQEQYKKLTGGYYENRKSD